MARLEAMQAELAAIRGELRDLRGAPGDDGLDRVRAAEDGLADR
jgi:hypothetical protein